MDECKPLIIGSMVGLLGFAKMASFRAALPFLVPMHCAMYMTHMIQVRQCKPTLSNPR